MDTISAPRKEAELQTYEGFPLATWLPASIKHLYLQRMMWIEGGFEPLWELRSASERGEFKELKEVVLNTYFFERHLTEDRRAALAAQGAASEEDEEGFRLVLRSERQMKLDSEEW